MFTFHPDPDDVPDDVRAEAAHQRRGNWTCAECGVAGHTFNCPNAPEPAEAEEQAS